MVETVIGAIIAIAKAIPILDGWMKQLITLYIRREFDNMRADDRAAIKKAVQDKDQRDLEKQMGNTHAGEPAPIADSDIANDLPSLPHS